MTAHLSQIPFIARCGADETDQRTASEDVMTLSATESAVCPKCVSLVVKERDEARETGLRFRARLLKTEKAIARSRKALRIGLAMNHGTEEADAIWAAYEMLDWRQR